MATAPFQKEREVTGGITVPCCEKTQASLGTVTGGAPAPAAVTGKKEALRQLQTQLPKHCKSTRTKGNQPPKSINHQNQKEKKEKWLFEASDLG